MYMFSISFIYDFMSDQHYTKYTVSQIFKLCLFEWNDCDNLVSVANIFMKFRLSTCTVTIRHKMNN